MDKLTLKLARLAIKMFKFNFLASMPAKNRDVVNRAKSKKV